MVCVIYKEGNTLIEEIVSEDIMDLNIEECSNESVEGCNLSEDAILNEDEDSESEDVELDKAKPETIKIYKSSFQKIDRLSEDKMVDCYQKKRDENTLATLYAIREPTLQVWARKYSYLGASAEDVLSDAKTIWRKCIKSYKYKKQIRKARTKDGNIDFDKKGKAKTVVKRTHFNTFLYTALRHGMSNVYKRQRTRKKLDVDGIPMEKKILSLDKEYDLKGSSDKSNLHDIIPGNFPESHSNIATHTLIEDIAKGDKDVMEVLKHYAYDSHGHKISSACKYYNGQLKLCHKDFEIFKNGHKSSAKKRLKEIIDSFGQYSKSYKIVSFALNKGRVVSFEIKRKDACVLRKTKKALEKYKQKIIAEDCQKKSK